MTDLFLDAVTGNLASAADYNTNWDLVQNSLSDLGPYIITGLTVSAGAGLAVTVAAGTASIGGRITASGSFSIAGLANNTTSDLYMRDDGTGTSLPHPSSQPASTVWLGTATTSSGSVTSVGSNWASGRQTKRRTEDLVHGAGAGHPRAVDLSSWHATNNEGNEVKGTLPGGAMGSIAFDDLSDVTLTSQARGDIVYRNASVWVNLAAGTSGQFLKTQGAGADPIWATISTGTPTVATKTANYTVLTTDGVLLGDATSASFTFTLPAVSGNSGLVFRFKKINTNANTVTVKGNGAETIDGANTAVLSIGYSSIDVVCNGTAWFIL